MNSTEKTIYLSVGELVVATTPILVYTVLGSCVSVCLYTKDKKAGGIIHFALPNANENRAEANGLRYADSAIPQLIEEIVKLTGKDYKDIQAKIVGGAFELKDSKSSSLQVGLENIKVTRSILSQYGIPIIGESIGGSSRKVIFHIPSGRLQVAKMNSSQDTTPTQRKSFRDSTLSSLSTIKMTASEIKAPSKKRKVLIVDDSKTIRELLQRVLKEDPDFEIIGMASDAIEASNIILKNKPDVITLDIHMPGMSGVQWLEKLLPTNPIPVVMISSLQLQEGNEVFHALELGAVDYIQKPSLSELAFVGPIIREKVKVASYAKVIRLQQLAPKLVRVTSIVRTTSLDTNFILAMGASTGGTEALKNVLCSLPERIPPTVIVQHIPPVFSKTFADRMNELCRFEVKEAEDRDELLSSRVLIAPGGKQMKIQKTTKGFCVRITDESPVNRHKPSVDYLFHSVASVIGKKSVGVILTGMGNDGAQGLLAMRKQGAQTIGQDEASSVVYGMPRVAYEIGAVEKVAPLSEIPKLILNCLERKSA